MTIELRTNDIAGSPPVNGSTGPAVLAGRWLGRTPYGEALALQRDLVARRAQGSVPDTILAVEHPHVFTFGRRSTQADLLIDPATLSGLRADAVETDRGGEATYHGPGQLVVYPIISLRERGLGPVAYVRILEECIIRTLRVYGVSGHRVVGKTGIWVGGEPGPRPEEGRPPAGAKVAAIGVRVTSGIAMHGFALNVSTDLSYFSYIVPCGMPDLRVASIKSVTRRAPDVQEAGRVALGCLADLFGGALLWE